jgi:hypothetical protein
MGIARRVWTNSKNFWAAVRGYVQSSEPLQPSPIEVDYHVMVTKFLIHITKLYFPSFTCHGLRDERMCAYLLHPEHFSHF